MDLRMTKLPLLKHKNLKMLHTRKELKNKQTKNPQHTSICWSTTENLGLKMDEHLKVLRSCLNRWDLAWKGE